MSDNELKPCPFCKDGSPYVRRYNNQAGGLGYEVALVACDCGAMGAERYGDECRVDAIKAWNTRTTNLARFKDDKG